MKKSPSIYKIALASLFALSCNKLIEIPDHPINEVPESQVFRDSANIQSAIAGVYNNFKAHVAGGSLGAGQVTLYTGMGADEILSSNASTLVYTQNTLPSSESNLSGIWNSGYSNLYQMNSIINNIPGSTAINDSLKAALVAEMKFTRAFYYFQLVNLWGGVPLIVSNDYNVTSVQPRVSVDEVYGLIQSDLAEARTVLQEQYPSIVGTKIRANRYTAMALSAKVFLYRQQWDSAAMMAQAIINSGLYSLETSANNCFTVNNKESIWELPSNPTGFNNNYQTGEGYTLLPFSQYSTPSYTLNPALLNAFEANDQRRTYWVRTIPLNGNNYYVPQKYKNRELTATPKENYMMFRLADMYLVLAEAQAQLGNTADAITNLDIVRTRAGLAGYTGSNDDLLAAIYHERQIEMAFEWGNRWYDLKRTGTIDAVLGALKPTWTHDAALWPIPMAQLNANVNLKQNDGY